MIIKDGIENETCEASFLMIGQSNMAGRGDINDVYPIKNPLCHMLRNGRWQPMTEPINPDRSIFSGKYRSGISLAASFADSYAKKYNEKVGLIPCADGGTKIEEWMPGELLFEHAVYQTKLAMRTSTLKGIIWHQGESNCYEGANANAYKEKFATMISALKECLGISDIPVIIGELARDYPGGFGERARELNKVFAEIEGIVPNCKLVSSEGLVLKADVLHFNSASLRIFGERYFEAYEAIVCP